MNVLKERYDKELAPAFVQEGVYDNINAVPRLSKIVVNMGIGRFLDDEKYRQSAMDDLTVITGQKPAERRAKKAISTYKLKEGDIIGLAVTLRGERMWDLFTRLVKIVLPRLRDFRGLPLSAFDGHGNYSFGIAEHSVFPEIDPNNVDRIKSLQVTLVTTAETDEEALNLLKGLGVPFEKKRS